MNANTWHPPGVESACWPPTRPMGEAGVLDRAGASLDFFTARHRPGTMGWRLPRTITPLIGPSTPGYAGDPMFRPAGTTPGHSFELAPVAAAILGFWPGGPTTGPRCARKLVGAALARLGLDTRGGLVYTLGADGRPAIRGALLVAADRGAGGAWPVCSSWVSEAQGPTQDWYRGLWHFVDAHFIDHTPWRAGFAEISTMDGAPAATQFRGKPRIFTMPCQALLAWRGGGVAPGLSTSGGTTGIGCPGPGANGWGAERRAPVHRTFYHSGRISDRLPAKMGRKRRMPDQGPISRGCRKGLRGDTLGGPGAPAARAGQMVGRRAAGRLVGPWHRHGIWLSGQWDIVARGLVRQRRTRRRFGDGLVHSRRPCQIGGLPRQWRKPRPRANDGIEAVRSAPPTPAISTSHRTFLEGRDRRFLDKPMTITNDGRRGLWGPPWPRGQRRDCGP